MKSRKSKKVELKIEELDEVKEPLNDWGLRGRELYLHQKNNVLKMEYQEQTKERVFTYGNRTTKIFTNMGILNDKVGSGKTLAVVSLLSRSKVKNEPLEERYFYPWTIDMGSNHYFSYITEEKISFRPLNLNIIVCSSSIFQQWANELGKTDLTYKKIIKTADISELDKSSLESLDVIIVTYNRYRDFASYLTNLYRTENIGFTRLIFDELQLTGVLPMTKAKFYWIISATLPYDDAGFSNRSLYNNAICTIMSGVKQKYVIVKNTDEELSQSYQQSEISYFKYMCFNRNFNMFGERVSNEIQRMIAADDIAGAISALGGTKDNISLLDIIISKEEKEITGIKAQISYYSILQSDNAEEKVKEYKQKLVEAEKSLENLKQKIKRDTEDDNECPLCSDEYKEPVLTFCCNSVMCSKCVKNLYNTTQKCPFCRVKLDMKNMAISSSKEEEEKKEEDSNENKITKLETVKNIISSNPNGKYILFSEFNQTFDPIKEALTESNVSFAEVKGTSDTKQKYIRLFKEGKIQVLFLNSRNDGSGIDLPETTDIILYHKMSSENIETQVLGRALRLGRTAPLKVHRLLYSEEENMEDNPRNIYHLHTSNLTSQELYRNQLREDQEREDRELAERLQNSL
jgi:superfamily II DNA or RNA helicase